MEPEPTTESEATPCPAPVFECVECIRTKPLDDMHKVMASGEGVCWRCWHGIPPIPIEEPHS